MASDGPPRAARQQKKSASHAMTTLHRRHAHLSGDESGVELPHDGYFHWV